MGKQSKRQRKFQSSGGVKGRIEKGTITKKGKLKKRKRVDHESNNNNNNNNRQKNDKTTLEPKRDRSNDFFGSDNLGDLNVDDFFAQAADAIENIDDDDSSVEQADASKDDHDDKEVEHEESKQNKAKAESSKEQMSLERKQAEKQEDSESESPESVDDDKKNDEPPKKKTKQQQIEKKSASSSDSSSDSDSDDDVEVAELRMKAQMAKLTKSDPEFHDFLQEHEQSLLDFGQEDEDDVEEKHATKQETDPKKKGSPDSILLTLEELEKLEHGVFTLHGLKHLKRLITAYRSACHLADTVEDTGIRPGESGIRYMIDSSTVFDKLMITCLSQCHEIFRYFLFGPSAEPKSTGKHHPKDEIEQGDDKNETKIEEEKAFDENKPIPPHKMEKAERWTDMRRILVSFFASTIHIMNQAKEPELLAFVLKALSKYIPLLSALPRVAEALLRHLVDKWSAPLDSSPEYQVVRIHAFFRIRQLATTQPFPFIELCLKKTYLAYARRATQGKAAPTVETLSTLTFMGNAVVEMYSLDLHSSYQHAFVYIRQLALHLRTAIQKATAESFQQLFRWQYIHCLKLWVAVIGNIVSQDDGAQMKSLLYPLTEVIYGVARLTPSSVRYLPYRLHCVRLLQQLAASSEMYIPTTWLLLDCLDWKEWYLKPKKTSKSSTTTGLDMLHILRLPKEDALRTHEQLEAAITELFQLLEREVNLYIYTAAFPEFSTWIRRRMKKFARDTRTPRWRKFADGIVELCEKNAKNAVLQRAKLSEAPKDVLQLECLRPPLVPPMKERHQVALDKEAKRLASLLQQQHPAAPSKTNRTTTKSSNGDGHDSHKDDEANHETEAVGESKQTKKSKNKSKAARKEVNAKGITKPVDMDPKALEQEDKVQQGLNWSDNEDDDEE